MEKLFDLNIEQVLEHWEPEHAVREIVANALDERILTNSQEIEIYKANGTWHIRDYGRGLQYIHFTQNENKEKTESPNLIGKFGVGLKDALGVFNRKGILVEINSKYANITLDIAKKSGFDIETLHASFENPKDTNMVGTNFAISGISDKAINIAKSMFLCFNENAKLLEETKYGDVYYSENKYSSIYVNGVQVATEENFLFSYNITNINSKIKKALNRERSNVGRTAYSDTVKRILQECASEDILLPLVDDLENVMRGTNKDESGWVDVATYAAKTLNKRGKVVFMTPEQRSQLTNQQVEILKKSGKRLTMITDNVYGKIVDSVITFDEVYNEYQNSFDYNFIDYKMLTTKEKHVFDTKENIILFLKEHKYRTNVKIKVSETLTVDSYGDLTKGVWDPEQGAIIIKRSVLASKPLFLGVLIHEFAHFHSGFDDNTREFENVLTELLGFSLSNNISKSSTDKSSFLRRLFNR